eukprot:gb/GECH01002239.1/.p1 GENE.gb/GECH01002239.1/~~gb/GECH01002239.1/.p1  ORF type:complete len:281 (+),score=57.20 gb/GECH01002239.1/:1-843(+)
MMTYTTKQVAEHNQEDDCWVILHGKVLDISDFLDEHPGGRSVLIDYLGQDVTEMFEGFGHSSEAKEIASEFEIGKCSEDNIQDNETLQKHEKQEINDENDQNQTTSDSSETIENFETSEEKSEKATKHGHVREEQLLFSPTSKERIIEPTKRSLTQLSTQNLETLTEEVEGKKPPRDSVVNNTNSLQITHSASYRKISPTIGVRVRARRLSSGSNSGTRASSSSEEIFGHTPSVTQDRHANKKKPSLTDPERSTFTFHDQQHGTRGKFSHSPQTQCCTIS